MAVKLSVDRIGSAIPINSELIPKLKKKLVVELDNETVKHYGYCTKNAAKSHLVIPRFTPEVFPKYFYDQKAKPGSDEKTLFSNKIKTPAKNPSIKWSGTSDDLQNDLVNRIMKTYYSEEKVKTGMNGLILKLETGRGKTFIGMRIISELQQNTLIVCHSELILRQWVKELRKFFDMNIGELYAKKKVIRPITVCIINTLQKKSIKIGKEVREMSSVFNEFGLIIYDEIHLYKSLKRLEIFNNGISYSLGLSATPDEDEFGRDIPLQWYAGPLFDTEQLIEDDNEGKFTASVDIIDYHGPKFCAKFRKVEEEEMLDIHSLYEHLMEDEIRNSIIVRETMALIKKKHNIFVFSHRRKHLEKLQVLLQTHGLAASLSADADAETDQKETLAEKSGAITTVMGGSSEQDLERGEAGQVILSTYQYMSTGKSIKKMNALVLALPLKKPKQTMGRIFRLGSDRSIERRVVDINDVSNHFVSGYLKNRLKYYSDKEFKINRKKVKHVTE